MEIEVTLTADETEIEEVRELLAGLDIESGIEEPDEEDDNSVDLSEEQRYVIAALREAPRSALRVVHRVATNLDGSPFDDYNQEDGWNEERRTVRELLWSMESEGLVNNDGDLWYPTEDAPTNVLQ